MSAENFHINRSEIIQNVSCGLVVGVNGCILRVNCDYYIEILLRVYISIQNVSCV